jgi:hypothetical protein
MQLGPLPPSTHPTPVDNLRASRPKLRSINAIRVIAEYAVVRLHVIEIRSLGHLSNYESHTLGPYGFDIMSFFFVLSGFVLMYTHHDTDFSRWEAKTAFIRRRLLLAYPAYLFCWLCAFPMLMFEWSAGLSDCWARRFCTFMQAGMLESWLGCGCSKSVMGVTWFLSCLMWLWIAFPFCKDMLVRVLSHGGSSIWAKLLVINLVWAGLFYFLWGYAIYTLAGFPPLRVGEFVMGCGVACAVNGNQPVPRLLAHGRYWYPVLGFILLYNLERQEHGMRWLCLYENSTDKTCSLWKHGQAWIDASPPCFFVLNKIPNKSALAWAVLIYGLSRAELAGETSWYMRILQANVFDVFGGFSMTLYTNHMNMVIALKFLGQHLLGWRPAEWNDDTILVAVYLACYGLHRLIIGVVAWLLEAKVQESEQDNQESESLLATNQDTHAVELTVAICGEEKQ